MENHVKTMHENEEVMKWRMKNEVIQQNFWFFIYFENSVQINKMFKAKKYSDCFAVFLALFLFPFFLFFSFFALYFILSLYIFFDFLLILFVFCIVDFLLCFPFSFCALSILPVFVQYHFSIFSHSSLRSIFLLARVLSHNVDLSCHKSNQHFSDPHD